MVSEKCDGDSCPPMAGLYMRPIRTREFGSGRGVLCQINTGGDVYSITTRFYFQFHIYMDFQNQILHCDKLKIQLGSH